MRIAPTPTITHRGAQQQRPQQQQQQIRASPSQTQSFVTQSPFGVRKGELVKQPEQAPAPQQQQSVVPSKSQQQLLQQEQQQQSIVSSNSQQFQQRRTVGAPLARAGSGQISEADGAREHIQRILSGDPELSWAIFKFEANQLQVQASGKNDFEQLVEQLEEDNVNFGYIRVPIGSDRRNKFVLIKWIGERCRPVLRARAFEDSKNISRLITVYHIEVPATRRGELNAKNILDRLQAAAGANYDREQNAAQPTHNLTADLNNYKQSSKQFFKNLERTGNTSPVVYESRPLPKATPVDLSNRPMTIGAAAAKQNIVDNVTALGQQQQVSDEVTRRQSVSTAEPQSRRTSIPGGPNPYLSASYESPNARRASQLSNNNNATNSYLVASSDSQNAAARRPSALVNNPYLAVNNQQSPAALRRLSTQSNENPYLSNNHSAEQTQVLSPGGTRKLSIASQQYGGIVDQYSALESPVVVVRKQSVNRRPSTAGSFSEPTAV